MRFLKSERGDVNIGGTIMMGIGMVFLAVGFIMFPIATDATDTILAYSYTGNAGITDASYTGLTSIVGITPLLILLGFVTAAVVTGFLGFKVMKSASTTKVTPGNTLMLGLSIVFVSLGLIIFPVVLDGVSSVYHGGGTGISSSYTGLSSVLLMTPMLVLLSFIAAAVLTGFFGIKSLNKAG
jgi:hypothetical protein